MQTILWVGQVRYQLRLGSIGSYKLDVHIPDRLQKLLRH